jgi:hypothetical protein
MQGRYDIMALKHIIDIIGRKHRFLQVLDIGGTETLGFLDLVPHGIIESIPVSSANIATGLSVSPVQGPYERHRDRTIVHRGNDVRSILRYIEFGPERFQTFHLVYVYGIDQDDAMLSLFLAFDLVKIGGFMCFENDQKVFIDSHKHKLRVYKEVDGMVLAMRER